MTCPVSLAKYWIIWVYPRLIHPIYPRVVSMRRRQIAAEKVRDAWVHRNFMFLYT